MFFDVDMTGYLFKTFTGLPAIYALIFSALISMILPRASLAPQDIWGVMMQLGAVRRGLSAQMGSVETTSSAAPRSFPDFSTSATACSSSSCRGNR